MGDTISRADAIEQIQTWAVNLINPKMLSREDAIYILESMPSAQPEREKGKWIDDGLDGIGAMGIEYRWQKCSNCGKTISKAPMQRFPNFCSNCGADMRGEQDE